MNNFKTAIKFHALPIGLFLLLSLAFCYPALQGLILDQNDIASWKAMVTESKNWHETTGEVPLWTNSMFGGMPTFTNYLLGVSNPLYMAQEFVQQIMPKPSYFLFLAMLCFYVLMMSSFKSNRWIAFFGAITYAFSAYNLQIMEAGHDTKMFSIAYLPLVVAGFIANYRGNFISGTLMCLLGLALMIQNSMLQIEYYTLILLLIMGIGFFIKTLETKNWKTFGIATVLTLASGLFAVLPTIYHLATVKEYGKSTMRGGKSELTLNKKETKKSGGLDKDYAFSWSQGIGETFTLFVPNLYGGGSRTNVGKNSSTFELLSKSNGEQAAEDFTKNVPLYWGPQPFLSGPNYFGIITMLLLVFSLFFIKNRMKWVLFSVGVLGIIMSWGKHFSMLNYFLFDNMPLFNNFRTPSMIMVLPAFIFCVLGFWALNEYFNSDLKNSALFESFKKSILIVGGITLFFGVGSRMFLDFKSENDPATKQQLVQMMGNNEQAGTQLFDAIQADRPSAATKDGLRSLVFILLFAGIIWLYSTQKLDKQKSIALIGVLIIFDIVGIGTRYLNQEHYVDEGVYDSKFAPRTVDLQIKQDSDPYYRVLDLTKNTYNDAFQAVHHKNIGGYHPAKMESYQDLIDMQITPGKKLNQEVLNMLNCKYIIAPGGDGKETVYPNSLHCGNAWFVSKIKKVNTADEAMNALNAAGIGDTTKVLNAFEAKNEAIVRTTDDKNLPATFIVDSNSKIKLNQYGLNKLTYTSENAQDGFAVFSEIYYAPGWKARIDNKETDIIPCDYVLRGIKIPAGKHQIEMSFEPETYFKTRTLSSVSAWLLVGLILGLIGLLVKKNL
ncbi:MAG: YfhO family protein [Chitinophagaceae bacterium]|nr:YfhO family protein [Chitinophagaceae bacterium]